MAIGTKCYCFPTFKDLFPRFARDDKQISSVVIYPFFERECKGKGLYIPTKYFDIYFEKKSNLLG